MFHIAYSKTAHINWALKQKISRCQFNYFWMKYMPWQSLTMVPSMVPVDSYESYLPIFGVCLILIISYKYLTCRYREWQLNLIERKLICSTNSDNFSIECDSSFEFRNADFIFIFYAKNFHIRISLESLDERIYEHNFIPAGAIKF